MPIVTFYRGHPNPPKTTRRTHLGANVILTCQGRLLLEKRRDSDTWGLVGGGVKNYETEEQAISREVYEELGLRIPAEAVYVSDGETGVYVVSGARVKWKKVEILWDSGTFLVVSDSGSLRVGDAVLLTDEPISDGDILP